jgi:hypothetical protein
VRRCWPFITRHELDTRLHTEYRNILNEKPKRIKKRERERKEGKEERKKKEKKKKKKQKYTKAQ